MKLRLLIFPSWFQGWQHDPSTLAGLLRLSCSDWGSCQLQPFQQDASSTVHLLFTLNHAHPISSSSWSPKLAPGLSLPHSHPNSSCSEPIKAVLGFPLVPTYPGSKSLRKEAVPWHTLGLHPSNGAFSSCSCSAKAEWHTESWQGTFLHKAMFSRQVEVSPNL